MVTVLRSTYLTTRILFVVELMQIIDVSDMKTQSLGQNQCAQCLNFNFQLKHGFYSRSGSAFTGFEFPVFS